MVDFKKLLEKSRTRKQEFWIIIAGSREFNNYDLLCSKMDYLISNTNKTVVVVSGAARGADKLGERWAKERGYRVEQYPADWDQYGKRAGPIRNKQMAEHANALVAFWDGVSRGTENMINIMKNLEKSVRVVRFNEWK